ncbi:ABC transporter ATP-binding protein [Burkholderia multivorans]|uniref:ABC transporter ATP-binding protein n=1 Tax=Burkholderia multivorans TaxID=87883 RepID=UPI001C25F62C|nr:ABC transporter ATP-binding protein [Burkholderia multivorans]MBU9576277.1 ABC transporter ATP-binding protein [Burkholderia multivorans]MDN7953805.1 ABC transporter ATP-binding protein [Burkholderia multivorans]MDN7999972.1 ABC transporter ATP-binding protein [Burkholderia multivorans]
MNATQHPVLSVADIQVAYGKTRALHGVSLEVTRGEIVALIGANGAGKSTTLRAISGLLPLSSGTITWNGNPIGGLPADRIVASGIAHCPEERHIWPSMTVIENLALGAYLCRSREIVERRMELAFDRFPRLRERSSQLAGTLSGGEQQMLAIARALMSEPRLLLLDEPSLGLSPKVAHEILDVIRAINGHGVTVLLVEQNVHNALSVAQRAYVFETGRITASRSAGELLDDGELLTAYLGG